MIIKVTKQQLENRLKNRPSEYLKEISSAMVKQYTDGSIDFETDHPAWKVAMAKYKPVRQSLKGVPFDFCKYAVRACCGQPHTCQKTGADCSNPRNLDCVHRD